MYYRVAILSVLFMFFILSTVFAQPVPPMPYTVGGTVTVDGTQVTNATDDGFTFEITFPDGSPILDNNDNKAEDTDGLNDQNWYVIQIPIYNQTTQPEGAEPGDTVIIHAYKYGNELDVTSPANGETIVGNSGENDQVDITAATPKQVQASKPVPTTSEWGMIIFSLLLGISAIIWIRRSQT